MTARQHLKRMESTSRRWRISNLWVATFPCMGVASIFALSFFSVLKSSRSLHCVISRHLRIIHMGVLVIVCLSGGRRRAPAIRARAGCGIFNFFGGGCPPFDSFKGAALKILALKFLPSVIPRITTLAGTSLHSSTTEPLASNHFTPFKKSNANRHVPTRHGSRN